MKINRKKFIKLGAASALSMSGFSLLGGAGCAGVRRSDFTESADAKEIDIKLDEKRLEILRLASLAPSAYNIQPWYVKVVSKDRWIIGADETRRMKTVDRENKSIMISIGAFLENLSLAAGAHGLKADIRIITDDFSADDLAVIDLKEVKPSEYPIERIGKRKTIKKGLLSDKIKEGHIRELKSVFDNNFFYYTMDDQHGVCIRDGSIDASQAWLDSDEVQKEFVKWVRLSNADAEKHRDGLTTEGMEIPGFIGFIMRLLFSAEDFSGDYMKSESMKITRKTAAGGAGYAVITGDGNSVKAMIDVGRRFQRMALLAVDYKIGIHPMSQMLEMQSGRDYIRASHSSDIQPQMILRMGYVEKYPDPVTLRRPVGWFLRND